MTEHKKLKPEIRFAGFTDDWEQRKLGDICNITTGKLDANAMVENGKYDFFTSGIKKYKIDHYAFLGPALTIAGNGATVGYMHYADGFFNAYQRTYVLTELLGDRTFLFSTINRKLQKKIQQEARAGNIPYIVLDMLTELDIYLPSLEEQTQIGNFFKQLDDTIALHQRTLEKYQKLKISYLEKMFPKGNELYPELRFPNFTDAWEQRKLGEIVDVFDGTHQTPKYTDKGIMFLSVEDIKTLKSEKYISEEDFKKEFKYFPEIGDVLMTRIGDVGTTNVICSTQPIAYYVSLALLKNKNSDPYFLSTVISSGSVQSDIWKRTLHIAFPKKINKSEIEKVIIPLPSYVEQTQIGNFFKQLDDTIALHQKELAKYQQIKTACLEKMFVE